MRVNRTYSIDYGTIKELNDTISAKHRSKFVDKAIKHLLNGCDGTDLGLIETKNLLAAVYNRPNLSPYLISAIEQQFQEWTE